MTLNHARLPIPPPALIRTTRNVERITLIYLFQFLFDFYLKICFIVQNYNRNMRYALCVMRYALCVMRYALCVMRYA